MQFQCPGKHYTLTLTLLHQAQPAVGDYVCRVNSLKKKHFCFVVSFYLRFKDS